MSTRPPATPGMAPSQALGMAFLVVLAGIIAILAASVDPWMLVMLAGLGVTAYAVFDRTADGWVLAV